MEFKDYNSFFNHVGDDDIRIHCDEMDARFPVSVEEVYRHFKARIIDEVGIVKRYENNIQSITKLKDLIIEE